MAVKRTICLKLRLSEEQIRVLQQLKHHFVNACNQAVVSALENKETNRVRLHHLCFYELRKHFPDLGSQMTCNALAKVSHSYKALLRKKKFESLPKIVFRSNASIHYDHRTYTLFKDKTLSLFTTVGRIRVPFKLGNSQHQLLERGVPKEAELLCRNNQWFFHLVLDLPDTIPSPSEEVMGIDVGENNLAATSTGTIYGGEALRHRRDQYLSFRARLQSNGSQSAKKRLRRVSGIEKRRVRHTNHEISKQIVKEAKEHNVGIIVMEDLTHIRDRIRANHRIRTRLHRWSFRELQNFVEYKAQAEGIRVLYVEPAYSSQICSECGQMGSRNRHCFLCSNCGNRQHSDLNASRNLCKFALSIEGATCAVDRTNVAMSHRP